MHYNARASTATVRKKAERDFDNSKFGEWTKNCIYARALQPLRGNSSSKRQYVLLFREQTAEQHCGKIPCGVPCGIVFSWVVIHPMPMMTLFCPAAHLGGPSP